MGGRRGGPGLDDALEDSAHRAAATVVKSYLRNKT